MKVAFKSLLMFPQFSFLVFVRSLSSEQLELVDHFWECQDLYLQLWCLSLAAAIWTVQLKREQLLPSVSPLLTWHSPYRAPGVGQFMFHLCVKPLLCELQSQGGLGLAVLSKEAWTMSVLVASSMRLATGSKAPGGASPKPCFLSLSRKIHILPPDTKHLRWRAPKVKKKTHKHFQWVYIGRSTAFWHFEYCLFSALISYTVLSSWPNPLLSILVQINQISYQEHGAFAHLFFCRMLLENHIAIQCITMLLLAFTTPLWIESQNSLFTF